MIRLYNTLSREKDPLPDQNKIRLFVCGPTVYDYAHIGHARTYIFFDFFAKYLRSQGYEVNYLQNITDVDDKIIRRAAEEGKKSDELAREFTEAYFADMQALGVNAVTEYAPATKFISQIVAQVERLIDKGFAYKIEGDGWYFDIAKDPEYGKLSGRTAEQAEDSVSRIDESVGKRNKGDFALWKFSKPGEPSWPAGALGSGRPGWHIEDTAITEFYFGPHYEIHGGGVDLKFPHHEAEIAQQESLREPGDREPLAKIWMHTGALLVDGKKMSKSLGNFVTVQDFLKKHSAKALRWIVFTHHYRSPIDYSEESVHQAEAALESVKNFWAKLAFLEDGADGTRGMAAFHFDATTLLAKTNEELANALADDVNTPEAIAKLFQLITTLQTKVWTLDPEAVKLIKKGLETIFGMFGISFTTPEIPAKVKGLAAERELSRSNKQFEQADALRQEINRVGFDIEDTPRGPFLWPRPKNHN